MNPDERIAAVIENWWRMRASRQRQSSRNDRDVKRWLGLFIGGWFLVGAIATVLH